MVVDEVEVVAADAVEAVEVDVEVVGKSSCRLPFIS